MAEQIDARAGDRRVVASYTDYADAQAAVDALADEGFPVERVAIVGSGLRIVEQVTGRLNVARAALESGLSGAFAGLVVGAVLSLFVVDDTDAFVLLLYGLLVGAVFGAIWGALAQAMTGGRRDFASVSGMVADRYEVTVDDDVADDARRRLETLGRLRPGGPAGSAGGPTSGPAPGPVPGPAAGPTTGPATGPPVSPGS